MKGQTIVPTYILAFIFIVLIFGFGFYSIFTTSFKIKIGLVTATEGMQSLAMMNKLITDTSCLSSTGSMGILDARKLDSAHGGSEHGCANLPNFGYKLTVTAEKDGYAESSWQFGENGVGRVTVRTLPVAIRDGAETYPGRIRMDSWYESGDDGDMLLRARSMVEQSWQTKGTYERAFSVGDYSISFDKDRVCYEGKSRRGDNKYCRGFVNPEVIVVPTEDFVFSEDQLCKLVVEWKETGMEVSHACIDRI